MKNKGKLIAFDIFFLLFLIALDQVTKFLCLTGLKGQESIVWIRDVFELRYLENKGAAFGMLQNQKIFFILIAVIILFVIGYVLLKTPARPKYTLLHVLLVLIAAGAIGNMIDRVIHDFVVDFFYFKLINFPIFNVADIYVTCATAALVFAMLFYYKENDMSFLSVKKSNTREVHYTQKED